MESTFITIHDHSPLATILYCSDSIVDILGFTPQDVINTPCWDYFHPDEIPIAQAKHGRSLRLDKAASLNYCRLRDTHGNWLGCEVVFTVVYDVMVGCISIYRRGMRSQNRAAEAPMIRRLFSTSPKDPRYHMLSHLSAKFSAPNASDLHEPRAALFLNRYTRTLTIMYATNGLADVLGISGDELRGRSFYYCIQEDCLQDSVRCLENAKENESIAYLRFWYRDPRQDDSRESAPHGSNNRMDIDGEGDGVRSSDDDSEMGGVELNDSSYRRPAPTATSHAGVQAARRDYQNNPSTSISSPNSQAVSSASSVEPSNDPHNLRVPHMSNDSGTSSGGSRNSTDPQYTHEGVFGEPRPPRDSSYSSVSTSQSPPNGLLNSDGFQSPRAFQRPTSSSPIELEAVISCTSDGLVVCLRRAHAALPVDAFNAPRQSTTDNGLYAVPWSSKPMMPSISQRAAYTQQAPVTFTPSLGPISAANQAPPPQAQPTKAAVANVQPRNGDFMNTIRDIAIFAWALVGINGSLADYSHGKPHGEAQPPAGLPIWQPEAQQIAGVTSKASSSSTAGQRDAKEQQYGQHYGQDYAGKPENDYNTSAGFYGSAASVNYGMVNSPDSQGGVQPVQSYSQPLANGQVDGYVPKPPR